MEKYSLECVAKNIEEIRERVRTAAEKSGRSIDDVKILAATKTVNPETINFAISQGIKYIGENRVQELLDKYDKIDKDNVEKHFIGRLQTNKVKYIIDKVSLIHSVDSYKLALEIDKQAKKHSKVMDILVEVNIGEEDSKGGVSAEETIELIKQISTLENVCIKGLMTIPPKCCETSNINEECGSSKKVYKNKEFFDKILKLFIDISDKKLDNIYMYELSAGMSDDYECAVECGSTIIRLGRAIFGERL